MLLPLPLGVFYLYRLDFDAVVDAGCGYSLNVSILCVICFEDIKIRTNSK